MDRVDPISLPSVRYAHRADSLAGLYAVDRLLGGMLLLGCGPILVGLAGVTLLLSRRGPFISHIRVGQFGGRLEMLKLRTMWNGAEEVSLRLVECVGANPPGCKARGDERVQSRFARLCRKYSLDELPQLWHVVAGRMSLVGPRPITRIELEEYYGDAADEIVQLRPGLTGLWQTMGRNRLTYAQRRRLDLFLARRLSFGLYARILLRTVPRVLSGQDAW